MTGEYLYEKWRSIPFPGTEELAANLFADLKKRYSEKGRYYHNLDHLAAMFRLFDEYKAHLQNPDIVALASFFHDVVYKATRKDNEEASAIFAEKKLSEAGFSAEKTALVRDFILATKNHLLPENTHPDLAFLLDFDLATLGAPREVFEAYSQQIRREYAIYPDVLYRPGRRKALEHFLQRPFIFHTPVFREKLEQRARENIRREIGSSDP